KLLDKTDKVIDDYDIIEMTEAFASQSIPVRDNLSISEDKLNLYGGAIALGHLLNMKGTENAYKLHRELGEIMTANVTVVRENKSLLETDKKIVELMERYKD
ncbi:hypothetical protein Q0M30_14980, partial [Staphylococcus aureus]|nr:hypothetical protein [Staphylococcus aureus]